MSWYSTSWSRRHPITVIEASTASNKDVEIDLSTLPDLFWDNVQSDGDDLRVTRADGTTVLAHTLASFSVANRTGTLTVVDHDGGTSGYAGLLWLYYGNAAATAPSAGTPAGSPWTGYADAAGPGGEAVPPKTTSARGGNAAQKALRKTATDELLVYWLLRDAAGRGLLESAPGRIRGRPYKDEPARFDVDILQAGSSSGGAAAANTDFRFLQTNDGALYARAKVTGGTSGQDYTILLILKTSDGHTRHVPVFLQVQTPTET